FSAASGASIKLMNGAKACNVFWRIDGASSLASDVTFKGTIVCNGAIDLTTGNNLEGRALSIVGQVSVAGVSAAIPIGCGSVELTGPGAPPMGTTEWYALLSTSGEMKNTGTT